MLAKRNRRFHFVVMHKTQVIKLVGWALPTIKISN
jgi:hypothetical protein